MQEIFYDEAKRTPSGYLAWRLRTVIRSSNSKPTKRPLDLAQEEIPEKRTRYTAKECEKSDIEFLKNVDVNQKEEIFLRMRNTFNYRKHMDFSFNEFPRFLDVPGLVSKMPAYL